MSSECQYNSVFINSVQIIVRPSIQRQPLLRLLRRRRCRRRLGSQRLQIRCSRDSPRGTMTRRSPRRRGISPGRHVEPGGLHERAAGEGGDDHGGVETGAQPQMTTKGRTGTTRRFVGHRSESESDVLAARGGGRLGRWCGDGCECDDEIEEEEQAGAGPGDGVLS